MNEKLEVPWELSEDKNLDQAEFEKPDFGVALSGKALNFMFLNQDIYKGVLLKVLLKT